MLQNDSDKSDHCLQRKEEENKWCYGEFGSLEMAPARQRKAFFFCLVNGPLEISYTFIKPGTIIVMFSCLSDSFRY